MKPSTITRSMKTALLLLVLISPNLSVGQVAADYFLPGEGKNLSVYGIPVRGNLKSLEGTKTHVFYKINGDSVLMTTVYYNDDSIRSWAKQIFKMTASQILLVKESSNKNSGQFSQEETILFKLPVENKKVEWESPMHSGSITNAYSSEFSTVLVDGKKSKAIKVTTTTYKTKSKRELVSTIDYYVSGIGLYKSTSPDDFVIQSLEAQKQTTEFPTLK